MVEYRVLQTEEQNEEVSYTAYGIQGFVNGQPVERIPDITTNRASAEKLVAMYNKAEVALCHTRDIVEDWLAE